MPSVHITQVKDAPAVAHAALRLLVAAAKKAGDGLRGGGAPLSTEFAKAQWAPG